MKQYDVVVLGATGFTGRLVCQHIMKKYHGKVPESLTVACSMPVLPAAPPESHPRSIPEVAAGTGACLGLYIAAFPRTETGHVCTYCVLEVGMRKIVDTRSVYIFLCASASEYPY